MSRPVAASALVLALTGAAHAAGLADGTFAEGATAGAFQTINAGNTIGAWTVTGGSVDLIGNYWQAPPTGGHSVDLDGNAAGTISQTFTLAAGEYNLELLRGRQPGRRRWPRRR